MSDTRPDSSPPKRRSRKPAPVPQPAAETPDVPTHEGGERIAKVMARAGLCSRRDAEAWIKEGRVAVNGKVLSSPALNIGPDDAITVDGRPVTARERTRLFLYHKPRGLVTTARDPEGRPTVFEALPDTLPRVVSVGRLDINTEGLLLLTNDGGLARVLELPATGWLRRYRVRANGFITQEKLDALRGGITIDGVDYAGIEAALDRTQGANQWLTMGLREGKNREIKRVLEHLGLVVNRLIRLSFGPFQLGELAEGAVEEVRTRVLKDQLGETLAAEAGAMWEDAVEAEVVTRDVASPSGKDRPVREDARQGDRPAAREPAPRTREGSASRQRDGVATRQDASRAERPRQDRPAPKARPHVSALRGEAAAKADTDGPRKRISRATTEDRRGRTVKVERVTVESRERVKSGEGGTSRNARNFARARREAEFGEGAPARKAGGARSRNGERTGGFSSERPLTGRALKDGKVRTAPDREATDSRPARSRFAKDASAAKARSASASRGAAPRQGDRPQGGKTRPQGGGGRQGGDRPRGGGGSRPPRGTK